MLLESLPVSTINKLELNEPISDLYIINSFSDEYPFVNYKNKIYMITNKDSYKTVALHGICMDFYAYSITRQELLQNIQSMDSNTRPTVNIKPKKHVNHRVTNQNTEKYSSLDQYEDSIKKCSGTKKIKKNRKKNEKVAIPKKKYNRPDKNLLWQCDIMNLHKDKTCDYNCRNKYYDDEYDGPDYFYYIKFY